MLLLGRRKIFTDEKEITRENIIDVLKKAYVKHLHNSAEIQYLMEYERGIQPLQREKKVRQEIDIKVCDNTANYVKKFNIGYFWSNPIMLVQRGNKEMHGTDENIDSDGINALNEMLKNAENISYKDQCMAEFLEDAGIGHRMVDIKTDFDSDDMFWKDGEYTGSLVNIYTLDSRYAFCVYYNGIGQKKMLGVTFSKGTGNAKFTCFTDSERFEIDGWKVKDAAINPLGKIPILEYERSVDRMGCFERSISEMDSLNIMVSDYTNDVAQRTQQIWWGDNIDFPKDEKTGEEKKPQSGEWVLTVSEEGKVAKIQPLSSTTDNTGTLSAIDKQRSWILQKCNVPLQYDSSGGGSTGVAMDISAGWSDAEVAAMQKQQMIEKTKREELDLILRAIRLVPDNVLPIGSPIRKVHSTDVEFKYNRKRNYDLSTKSNAFATLVSHGINGRHALKIVDLFSDVEQVWIDSKDGIESFQKSAYENSAESGQNTDSDQSENAGRIMQDLSDQTENSPILSGQ